VKNKLTLVILLFACIMNPLVGESIWVKYGNQLFQGSGDAASISLGEANIAAVSGPLSLLLNPARLYFEQERYLSFSHQERFSGLVSYDVIGFHLKDNLKYKRAFVLIREGVQRIPNTTRALLYDTGSLDDEKERIMASKITYFNQVQWGGIFGLATMWGDWIVGGNVKGIIHQLGSHTGYGVGFDFGVYRVFHFSNTFAITIRDVTSSWIIWESGTIERIAPEVVLGDVQMVKINSLNLEVKLLAATLLSFSRRTNTDDYFIGNMGGNFRFGLDIIYKTRFHLRLGRNTISNYTSGLGFLLPFGSIDYAFMPSPLGSILGNSHYLTLNVKLRFLSSLLDSVKR